MRQYVSGRSKSLTVKELRIATKFLLRELVGDRTQKNIKIHLRFANIKDQLGSCEVLGRTQPYRVFAIEINPFVPRATALKILAHELVHVKQFATGELKEYVYREESIWRNSKGRLSEYVETDSNYSRMPWEKEAYREEKRLYKLYRDYIKANAHLLQK
jgi:predicted metallopeptidase